MVKGQRLRLSFYQSKELRGRGEGGVGGHPAHTQFRRPGAHCPVALTNEKPAASPFKSLILPGKGHHHNY